MIDLFIRIVSQKFNINFEKEVVFHNRRKWRFDLADKENKIAVEIEGGIWTNGAHARGKGIARDIEKYNAAQSLGWKVYRTTPSAFSNVKRIGNIVADFGLFLFPPPDAITEIKLENLQREKCRERKLNKIKKLSVKR